MYIVLGQVWHTNAKSFIYFRIEDLSDFPTYNEFRYEILTQL